MDEIEFDEEDALDRVLNHAISELQTVRMRFSNESDYVLVKEFNLKYFESIKEYDYEMYGKYRGEYVMINKEDFNIYQKTKYLTQNFVLFNILNFCRKKIKYNETLPIILGKFYTKSPNVNEGIQNNVEETYKVDSITSEIINSMDSSTIIINRGNYKLPIEFKNLCLENNLTYLELSPTYELLKNSGIIFDKWNATNKFGHWQHSTHKAIGVEIANEMSNRIQKQLNHNTQHK